MTSENSLISGCKNGDRKSQRQLYDQYASKMMMVCLRYSKSDQEAEDILQESFIKVFDKIKGFKEESRLIYWIKRIVINTALNHGRKKLYMFPMVDINEVERQDNDDISISSLQLQELLKMIHELPSGCQIIFNLYAIEGYNHNEIADMLEISVGTSKSQYARARYLLREMIGKEEITYGNAR
ncbi:MAG: RNA polymerase sigma factor [Bacteroidota bacterium]